MFDYQLHHRVLSWLNEAGENLKKSIVSGFKVEEKTSASDLVTEMDRATEKFFVDRINHYYPEHKILAEEGLAEPIDSMDGYVWVIDPIDGTLNFVKQNENFAIMVGIFHNGKALAGYIYNVMADELFYGIVGDGLYRNGLPYEGKKLSRISDGLIYGNTKSFIENRHNCQKLAEESLGVRTNGSAALDTIAVVKGHASLYFAHSLNPWDVGAGLAICETIGFKVSRLDGSKINMLEKGPVIFSQPGVYEEAINLLK